jgi:tetratricopeptide (TPR) repeat protein
LLQAELERLEGLQGKTSDISFGKAHVLYELGELSMSTDRKTAKNYYQKSLSLYDALGDERGQALVLISLGEALHHTGPLDQAQKYLERGIVLCRKLGDPRLLARCIYWSGWNYIRQGSFSEGEALVRESIEINRSIGDRYAEAFSCAELGRVVGWSGHLRESLELLSQSIGIYHELNLKQEATFILQVKGLVEQILLELAPARQDLQTGVFASYQQKYLRGIGGGMYGLGCISLSEGDLQKAEELFLQAIPILRDVQADEEGWCVALLVFTMRGMNQPQRAWQYARQALEIGLKAHVFLTVAVTIR